jgi:hypothetical protein
MRTMDNVIEYGPDGRHTATSAYVRPNAAT